METKEAISVLKDMFILSCDTHYTEEEAIRTNEALTLAINSLENQGAKVGSSWKHTHHEIVSMITAHRASAHDTRDYPDVILDLYDAHGTHGLYELAEEWTNEFEKKHSHTDWEENDYWETIEKFFNDKIKQESE